MTFEGLLSARAIPGALAVALLSGCGASFHHPPLLDADTYDLTKAGITCRRGLRWDDARGCNGDVGPGETALSVAQRDEMSSVFRLVRVLYALDGHVAYLWNEAVEEGAGESPDPPGAAPAPRPILDVGVLPGPHELQVLLFYRGHGYGVFTYLRGYKFEVRSTHPLVLAPGARTLVTMRAHEQGGIAAPLQERPAVQWTDAP